MNQGGRERERDREKSIALLLDRKTESTTHEIKNEKRFIFFFFIFSPFAGEHSPLAFERGRRKKNGPFVLARLFRTDQDGDPQPRGDELNAAPERQLCPTWPGEGGSGSKKGGISSDGDDGDGDEHST